MTPVGVAGRRSAVQLVGGEQPLGERAPRRRIGERAIDGASERLVLGETRVEALLGLGEAAGLDLQRRPQQARLGGARRSAG